MQRFNFSKEGCLAARKFLLDNNLTNRCDAGRYEDGFTFIECCNILYEKLQKNELDNDKLIC